MAQDVEMSTPSKYPENLSHHVAFTAASQLLTPYDPIETLPGDSFEIKESSVVELAPFNSIFFGDVKANYDTFFVSSRTLYGDLWYKYFLLRIAKYPAVNLYDLVPPPSSIPVSITNQYWKILDMLKYPIGITSSYGTAYPWTINPTKFFAYWKIIRDYYVDPTLDVDVIDKLDDAFALLKFDRAISDLNLEPSQISENITNIMAQFVSNVANAWRALWQDFDITSDFIPINLFQRRLKRDYFTSLLPNLQFGEPLRIPVDGPFIDSSNGVRNSLTKVTDVSGEPKSIIGYNNDFPAVGSAYVVPGTIRDLQRIESVQKFLERLNFAGGEGAHPKDLLEAIYGESPDDITIGRAIWLNSFDKDVIMSEVVQTSNGSQDSDPLGTKVANGQIASSGNTFSVFTKEHGYIINMYSLMPRVYYAYNARDSFKFDFADYYLPDLSMIGEQEVLGRELITEGNVQEQVGDDYPQDLLVGYQPRYQEYRQIPNSIHGGFRTTEAQQMLHGRVFDNRVNLNSDFIQLPNEKFNQIFSYINPAYDTSFVHMIMEIHAVRPVIDNPTRV